VVANLPDMSLAPVARLATHFLPLPLITQRIEEFNAAVGRVVTRHGLLGVDLHTPSRVELPRSPDYFSPDGFHPSDRGYMRMAEHFWPALHQAVERGTNTVQATG